VHKRCSGIKGALTGIVFQCDVCNGKIKRGAVQQGTSISDGMDQYDCVNKFCYLGDIIGAGGGSEEASRTRVKLAWGSFRDLAPIIMTCVALLVLKFCIVHV